MDLLGYFIVGAASCYLTQAARIDIMRGLKTDDLEMTAIAHLNMAREREFSDMKCELKLKGSESKTNAMQLAKEAEGRCFSHRTLSKAIQLTTNVSLIGQYIGTHTVGPSASGSE